MATNMLMSVLRDLWNIKHLNDLDVWQPDEDVKPRHREDEAGGPVDPCWRCGEPVIAKNFGGVRHV